MATSSTGRLDLRAADALLESCAAHGELTAIVPCDNLRALLAHCRALRAALRMHVCHRDGYMPACVEYAALHKGAHRPECAQSVAVLAATGDAAGAAPEETDP